MKNNNNRLIMIEIIISVFVFVIGISISTLLFSTAHSISFKNQESMRAMNTAKSIINIVQKNGFDTLPEYFNGEINENIFTVNYTENNTEYKLTLTKNNDNYQIKILDKETDIFNMDFYIHSPKIIENTK